MSFTNDFAKICYEFFRQMREEIKTNGMNGHRYNAIVTKLREIPTGNDPELCEVREMGQSLIQRPRLM
jgi:cell fate (sporulation/competence/biofilm development) regulator YlbF (YheA/YmcA/DUF963 family)